jgi:hypothetical protein
MVNLMEAVLFPFRQKKESNKQLEQHRHEPLQEQIRAHPQIRHFHTQSLKKKLSGKRNNTLHLTRRRRIDLKRRRLKESQPKRFARNLSCVHLKAFLLIKKTRSKFKRRGKKGEPEQRHQTNPTAA